MGDLGFFCFENLLWCCNIVVYGKCSGTGKSEGLPKTAGAIIVRLVQSAYGGDVFISDGFDGLYAL